MDDFTDFYHAQKDRVFRVALAAGRHRTVAEDAVAEAFARAYARWSRVREHPNPSAWVMLAALNLQRSWWRRVRREVLQPSPRWSLPAEPASTAMSAPVHAAIAALPRRQREVVALRVVAQLSPAETAELLGIAPGTVGVHLSRALAALRASLSAPVLTVQTGPSLDLAPEVDA